MENREVISEAREEDAECDSVGAAGQSSPVVTEHSCTLVVVMLVRIHTDMMQMRT